MGLSSKQVSSDVNGWKQALSEGGKTTEFPKTSPLKTQEQEQVNCPRCDSSNTKFCYYNNYNKSQPRHFCKACKRHWTKGGTLRNVPVGGGRKNKRLKTSKNSSKTTAATPTTMTTTTNTNKLRVSPPFGGPSFSNSAIEDHTFSEAFLKQQPNSLPQTSITFNITNNNNNDDHDQWFLLGSTLKTTSLGLSSQQHDDQDIQFPYSNNLGSFESNPCSISSTIPSIHSPILYNFTGDHVNSNDGLSENHHHHKQHHPWMTMHTSSSNNNNNNNNSMDMMSSSWGWDDFDKFVSVEADLTIPWDDSEIKP